MGLPMAKNLIGAGHSVRGVDINPASLNSLIKAGGEAFSSAGAACSGAQLLIIMVVNADQAKKVLFDGGALDALSDKAIVCLMTTCSPAEVERIAERVNQAGKRLVDCPVSGGVVGAVAGSLTIMAACDEPTFNELHDLFAVVGGRLFHVGQKPGQGAMCKTINQLLCGLHIAVAAEAFSLAKKGGLNLDLLLAVMSESSASSWMLKDRGPRMLQTTPEVTSAVDIFVKDLRIVSEVGRDTKAALPLTTLALQMFIAASGRGEGKMDDSQVIRSFDAVNGIQATN